MSKLPEDWYPKLNFEFPSGATLEGDFDTGAPMSFISYEWLVENSIIKPANFFIKAKRLGSSVYQCISMDLPAALLKSDGAKQIVNIRGQTILDWESSPYSRSGRVALIGRNLLEDNAITVEIDGSTGDTRVIFQNWESFESEVASLYALLGIEVHRNYSLAGNQIDVYLVERTASGKTLSSIVECKFHQKAVGIQYVRELAAILDFARSAKLADHAILVSSSGFSKDAHIVAQTAGIELIHIDELRTRVNVARSATSSPPIAKSVSDHVKESIAFVIMPFGDEYRDIYLLGIRDTLASHSFVCKRADEFELNGRIMAHILANIRDADLVVAEVSEHNPNVYYELGVAHAMGKNVVLLVQNAKTLPFDTRDLNHIVYSSIVDLREMLSRRLESLIITCDEESG